MKNYFLLLFLSIFLHSSKIVAKVSLASHSISKIGMISVCKNSTQFQTDTIKKPTNTDANATFVNARTQQTNNNSRFVLTASLGAAFRLGKLPENISPEIKDYSNRLKSGISYDFGAYYIADENGYGLKLNFYRSSGSIKNQIVNFDDGTSLRGSISDDVTILFVGPSFILLGNQGGKIGEPSLEMALGYMSYVNNANIVGLPVKISGGTLGLVTGFGYHFKIVPNFLIGGQLNFIGGALRKIIYTYPDGSTDIKKLPEDSPESLWRIDLSLGAKFRF